MAIKQRPDSPTNNFATLNPLDVNSDGLSNNINNGNLYSSNPDTDYDQVRATFYLKAGKWYWEVLALFTSTQQFGVVQKNYAGGNGERRMYQNNALKYSSSSSSYGAPFTNGDVIGIFLDLDNGEITFYNNGTTQNVAFTDLLTSIDSVGWTPTLIQYNSTAHVNFGQDPSFGGATNLPTGAGDYDTDAAGNSTGGRFAFQPPTGAKALCTANLPEMTPNVAGDVPKDYFKTVIWKGDGNYPRSISTDFAPDLIWTKARTVTPTNNQNSDHLLMDSVRGDGNLKWISPSYGGAEGVYYDNANADLTSSGFTIQSTPGTNCLNDNNAEFVAWCFRAGGNSNTFNINGTGYSTYSALQTANTSLPASSTSGMIVPSGMSINTDAGFSIVKYTGTGEVASVPHGLDKAPEMVIVKKLTTDTGGNNWAVYHKSVNENYFLYLNGTLGELDYPIWNDTPPSSTVITLGDDSQVGEANRPNIDTICYAWHSVEGYSKFGSYVGNNSADGPFVYTGFRVGWLMVKDVDTSGGWVILDNKRSEFNVVAETLFPHLANEESSLYSQCDFLSNGFKWRADDANSWPNHISGNRYIYMAFAEQPFNYANAR
jgi:hypothetical protein